MCNPRALCVALIFCAVLCGGARGIGQVRSGSSKGKSARSPRSARGSVRPTGAAKAPAAARKPAWESTESEVVRVLNGDTVFNQIDSAGRRVGWWRRPYRNGKPAYLACFVDGRPVGVTRRYDESGRLTALLRHRRDGSARVVLYANDGSVLGEGLYADARKDSVWTYYSRGRVVLREGWRRGLRDGVKEEYADNGVLIKRENWSGGRLHGRQEDFFATGAPRSVTEYDMDLAEGPHRVYYPSGRLCVEGSYHVDDREGPWRIYAPDGSVEWEVVYRKGVPEDTRRSDYIDSVARSITGRAIRIPEIEEEGPAQGGASGYDGWEQ